MGTAERGIAQGDRECEFLCSACAGAGDRFTDGQISGERHCLFGIHELCHINLGKQCLHRLGDLCVLELLPDQMDVRDFICRRRSVDLIFRDAICGDAHRNGQSVGAGFCYFHFNRAFCRIVGNVILLSQRTAVRFLQHILVSTRLCKLHLTKIDGSACAVGNGLSAFERIVGRIAGVRHQSKLKFTAGQGVSAGQDLACVEFQADRERCVHLRCHAVRHAGGIIVNDILVRRNCIGIPLFLHGVLADQVIIDVALEGGQARHPPTFWDLALQICDGKFRLLQRCVLILCALQEFILHLRNRLSAFLAV